MNSYNYVRVSNLEPISIESLAILVAAGYFFFLALRGRASLEILYFLALPFSDEPFRIASSMQPVEAVSVLLVVLNYREIRLNFVILLGLMFVLFSLIGLATGNVTGLYSPLYSLKFLLLGLTFSVLIKREWSVPISVLRFMVVFAFSMTFLQTTLWMAGLPIHGVFYEGLLPRAKGLAHEPATWSIFVVTLFAFILHFKLGRMYVWLNAATLALTLSTFGIVATLSFLAIRWILGVSKENVIRIKKAPLRVAGVMLALAVILAAVHPEALQSAARLLTVFDKLVAYQEEIAKFAGGQDTVLASGGSGRGLDLDYFRAEFPRTGWVGIGSFNAPYTEQGRLAATNTYLILPVEIGTLGMAAFAALLWLHYAVLLRDWRHKSVDFLAMNLNLLLMIAGIRCLGFSEVWYAQAATLRTAARQESEERLPDGSDAPAFGGMRTAREQ